MLILLQYTTKSMPLFSLMGPSSLFKQLEPMNTSTVQRFKGYLMFLRPQYSVGKLWAEKSLSSSLTTFWKQSFFCNFDQSYNKIALFRATSDVIIVKKKKEKKPQQL